MREIWLKEGDKNTKFFRKMAHVHRRIKFMGKIKVNGVWLNGENKIKEGVAKAYHNFFV